MGYAGNGNYFEYDVMNKAKSKFVCQSCGAVHQKWSGRCDACGAWNSIEEEFFSKGTSAYIKNQNPTDCKIEMHSLTHPTLENMRDSSGMPELDRALGGGLVKGSAILLGGDPGIGKSTLLLQLADRVSNQESYCLYISGEESEEQIKLRALRLSINNNNVKLACGTMLKDILSLMENSKQACVVIIDSIQTMYHDEISAAPGTVSQVRACAFELIQVAKKKCITLILVGHVTKDGQIAGPKVLEHMVDAVLYFEGEAGNGFRIIRAVKNRYGAANEIGIFEMQDGGLMEVNNPSSLFLSERTEPISGVAVFAGIEGSRPILVEVQALIVPTFMASPRRSAVGWDNNRLAMLLAVLNSRYGLNLLDKEVYLNFAGGIKMNEPAADLAVAAALISATNGIPIDHNTVFFGEIGLSGEVRKVSHHDMRQNEAFKLGFKHSICPTTNKKNACNIEQLSIIRIDELKKIIC